MQLNTLTPATAQNPITESSSATGPAEENRSLKRLGKVALGALALGLLAIAGSSLRGEDGKASDGRWKIFVIDVAEDARTARVNTASPTDTEPKRGATAISNGKIYPGGTLPAGNGLDIDALTGSIGTWITRDTFNFDLSAFVPGTAPLLSATQYFLFSPTGALDGQDSLMSDGPEFGVTTHRVVLGGTGQYRGMIGEVKQETLGFNSTGFGNFRFTFTVRTPE